MVKLTITEETYSLIRESVASILQSQVLFGKVTEWDDGNCKALLALLELNDQTIEYIK